MSRQFDEFLLKETVVLLHELLQTLPSVSGRCICPHCETLLKLSEADASGDTKKSVKCPACKDVFVVIKHLAVKDKVTEAILNLQKAGVPMPQDAAHAC